jgi:Na+/H+ antiporter NhaD/arsenite permease-like protein
MPVLGVKFVAAFVFMSAMGLTIFFDERKNKIVWSAALIMVLSGALSFWQALESVEWDVMVLYIGMVILGEVLSYSMMPKHIATRLILAAKTSGMAMFLLCIFAGFMSMFIMNIAVIFLLAPIALALAKKCEANPILLFSGMVLMANLEGAATMIGDPPSMMLAGFGGLSFVDFFIFMGRPGIFFAIQFAALACLPVLWYFFRGYNRRMPQMTPEPYVSTFPSLLVMLLVVCLAAGSMAFPSVAHLPAGMCLIFGIIGLVWYVKHSGGRTLGNFVLGMDWHTGAFLVGVFILVGGLHYSGVIEDISKLIMFYSGKDSFMTFLIVVVVSVVFSAFILNIPYIALMLPVTEILSWQVAAQPHLLSFALLLAGSVGGNATPVGASANIVAMGVLKESGYKSGFLDFVRIGLPFTLVSSITGCAFIWFVFS